MALLYKFKNPSMITSQSIRAQLLNAVRFTANRMKVMLDLYVSTWKHKVEFYTEVGYKGGEIYAYVNTNDEIFFYIDQGTHRRYAKMSKDFIPKTTPHSTFSGTGRGGKVGMSRRPLKGITARKVTDEVADALQPELEYRIQLVFNEITWGGTP